MRVTHYERMDGFCIPQGCSEGPVYAFHFSLLSVLLARPLLQTNTLAPC